MPDSKYLKDAIHNEAARNTNYVPPTTLYLALFSVAPASDGTGGTELTGNGYARQAVTFAAPTTVSATQERVANSAAVSFPAATAAWLGSVAGWLFDASTAGNPIAGEAFGATVNVNTGEVLTFAIGAITWTR